MKYKISCIIVLFSRIFKLRSLDPVLWQSHVFMGKVQIDIEIPPIMIPPQVTVLSGHKNVICTPGTKMSESSPVPIGTRLTVEMDIEIPPTTVQQGRLTF